MNQGSRATKGFLGNPLVKSGAPFVILVVAGWVGLSVLLQSKFEIRKELRGYNAVEEYDPMDNLNKLASQSRVESLEEEYNKFQKEIDINDFDYKPVPRTEDPDE